jgi:hypothetical protein
MTKFVNISIKLTKIRFRFRGNDRKMTCGILTAIKVFRIFSSRNPVVFFSLVNRSWFSGRNPGLTKSKIYTHPERSRRVLSAASTARFDGVYTEFSKGSASGTSQILLFVSPRVIFFIRILRALCVFSLCVLCVQHRKTMDENAPFR